jgi:short-subunit dehydrogenase
MAIDYFAPVALTKGTLPAMLKEQSGQVVVVSSVQGRLALPFRTSYGGAKHALHGYFEALRGEVAQRGVGVTMVRRRR